MNEFDNLEGMLSKKREDDASRPEKIRQSRARAKERLEQMLKDSDFIARLDSIVEWMNTKSGSSFSSTHAVKLTPFFPTLDYHFLSYRIDQRVFFFKKEYFQIEVQARYQLISNIETWELTDKYVLEVQVRSGKKGNFVTYDSEEEFFDKFKAMLVRNIDNHASFK